jgi:hypothetical protein
MDAVYRPLGRTQIKGVWEQSAEESTALFRHRDVSEQIQTR